MQPIIAIDLIEGQCVRLSQGNYNQKTLYAKDPVEMAKKIAAAGIRRLHLVDLDGAKAGKVINLKVLERIAQATDLEIDFSGGIKERSALCSVWDAGAKWAAIGSLAVKNPDEFGAWILEWGAERFLLGADVKQEKIAISGWLEQTSWSVFDLIQHYAALGLQQVFCTDVAKDGMMQGPSLDLYKKIIAQFPHIQLIASGGISSLDDLKALANIGCKGAIIGKAFYEGHIRLEDLVG